MLRAGDRMLAEVGHTEVAVIPRATDGRDHDRGRAGGRSRAAGAWADPRLQHPRRVRAGRGVRRGQRAVPRVADRRADMERSLLAAAASADVIVTTGGISMGELDCVKEALEALGAERVFWRVAQKPAGPLGFWRLAGGARIRRPGNPVAAMIVMEEYVRPVLRKMMSLPRRLAPERPPCSRPVGEARVGPRLHFLRVVGREEGGAGAPGSGTGCAGRRPPRAVPGPGPRTRIVRRDHPARGARPDPMGAARLEAQNRAARPESCAEQRRRVLAEARVEHTIGPKRTVPPLWLRRVRDVVHHVVARAGIDRITPSFLEPDPR